MKTFSQEELEQKAIDSMIAYERGEISKREMHLAISHALHHYKNIEGHHIIVLKGFVIKAIHALNKGQVADLDNIVTQCLSTEY